MHRLLVLTALALTVTPSMTSATRQDPAMAPAQEQLTVALPVAPATVLSSGPLATAIPDSSTMTSIIPVPYLGVVLDLKVRLRINHPRVSDLDIYLIAPDGTTVELATDVGYLNADFGAGNTNCTGVLTGFDDGSNLSVFGAAAPFLGTFRPEQPLAQFKGRMTTGNWTLRITDDALFQTGTLYCWEMVLRRTAVLGDPLGIGRSRPFYYRPGAISTWLARNLEGDFTNSFSVNPGVAGDIPVVGNFTGDGVQRPAVFRPSTGQWVGSVPGSPVTFGTGGDVPVPGDYDANGIDDIAVFRPSTGIWYVLGVLAAPWGTSGDIPVPGDYTGDGATDLAIFRPSTSTWYVKGLGGLTWGIAGDIPVPADYNGDGRTDFAVWRPSEGIWYIYSSDGVVQLPVTWGVFGDIPVPADYDGDGKADLAVWRPSEAVYYIRNIANKQWGQVGDLPVQKRPTYPGYPY